MKVIKKEINKKVNIFVKETCGAYPIKCVLSLKNRIHFKSYTGSLYQFKLHSE